MSSVALQNTSPPSQPQLPMQSTPPLTNHLADDNNETTTPQPAPEEMAYLCAGTDCDKPAKMQCPTCVKFQGPATFFCDQECFKKNWALHSRLHPELRARFEFKPPLVAYSGPLRPAYVTPQQKVTDPKIQQPDYAQTSVPLSERTSPAKKIAPVYTKDEIAGIRAACELTRRALDYSVSLIQPGVSTDEIDSKTHNFIIKSGGYPSPLNYHGFKKSICTSINEVICHGIPDLRPLKEGDILNIDVSVFLNGFHGDCNETHTVGKTDYESKRLVKASYDSLFAAIKLVKPGAMFRDFGEAVSISIRKHGYSSVRSYCGHGIGHLFHGAPDIPHYARNKANGVCKPGMVICIEPMINAGDWKDIHWPDDWTATTVDGKRSAQFEHSILVTESGYELLTKRTAESRKLWWEEEDNETDLAKYNAFLAKK